MLENIGQNIYKKSQDPHLYNYLLPFLKDSLGPLSCHVEPRSSMQCYHHYLWRLGIVEEPIVGCDRIMRAVRLRAGKKHLEQAVQQLRPLELSCDMLKDSAAPSPMLNP